MQLWVSEYGRISRASTSQVLPGGNLELVSDDFDALLNLQGDADKALDDSSSFFSYSRVAGQARLTMQNYAGVIALETGTQIEVLPKISKIDDPDTARKLLVKMLIELKDSPFKRGSAANLDAHRMRLFEVLMRQFLDHVTEIVRKGIARRYQPYRDNLIFLRGKLQLADQIRINLVRRDRAYCEYDEYEANRPINRLIRRALDIVASLTRDNRNRQLCRELTFWFGEVPPSRSISFDLARIQRDRLVQHYLPAWPSCLMILEGLNPLTQQGHRKSTALLFPMEKVFEDYVASKLRVQFPDWQVRTQVFGKALVERHLKKQIFELRPDIVLQRGGERVVADTKWKLLRENDRSKKYNISQSDMYQLFAYTKKYLPEQGLRESYLIYPRTSEFRMPLKPFWFEEGKEVLHVLPYDLERQELILAPDCGLSSDMVRQAG